MYGKVSFPNSLLKPVHRLSAKPVNEFVVMGLSVSTMRPGNCAESSVTCLRKPREPTTTRFRVFTLIRNWPVSYVNTVYYRTDRTNGTD